MAPPGYKGPMKYSDIPPTALTVDGIKRTIGNIVVSATLAIETAGFDGVEVHGANGYLVEQRVWWVARKRAVSSLLS